VKSRTVALQLLRNQVASELIKPHGLGIEKDG
jgi:hypothetical protein